MPDRIFQPYPGEILPGGEGVQPQISTATGSGASVGSATPPAIASASVVGVSANASHEDHTHEGVHSVNGSKGDVTVTVPSAAASVTDVASAGVTGTSANYAREDHVHRGVFTVGKLAGTGLVGAVTLSEGSGITITPSGNDLQIAASGGGGGLTRTVQVLTGFGSNITLIADNTRIYVCVINCTLGLQPSVTLPNPAAHANEIWIYLKNSNTSDMKVIRYSGEKIDGVASDYNMPITGPRRAVFISDGTNWWPIQTEV